jgi:hypothetical protein
MSNEALVADQPIYPWYATVNGDAVEQGDLLPGFDIVVPTAGTHTSSDQIDIEFLTFDVMVMTQTCDIQNHKVDSILLCPWWDLWQFIEAAQAEGKNWGRDLRDALRRGNMPGYHLLNSAFQDGRECGLGIVDFHTVYTAPAARVQGHAASLGNRLRLCPPYREHLAQAFARFFMRVGLPIDIPEERIRAKPKP